MTTINIFVNAFESGTQMCGDFGGNSIAHFVSKKDSFYYKSIYKVFDIDLESFYIIGLFPNKKCL